MIIRGFERGDWFEEQNYFRSVMEDTGSIKGVHLFERIKLSYITNSQTPRYPVLYRG